MWLLCYFSFGLSFVQPVKLEGGYARTIKFNEMLAKNLSAKLNCNRVGAFCLEN